MRRALDPSDRESFVAWLDALAIAINDARDAGIEAVRSRHRRTLSRAELSRRLTDAHGRLADLVDAARRGLGPTPAPDAGDTMPPASPAGY